MIIYYSAVYYYCFNLLFYIAKSKLYIIKFTVPIGPCCLNLLLL